MTAICEAVAVVDSNNSTIARLRNVPKLSRGLGRRYFIRRPQKENGGALGAPPSLGVELSDFVVLAAADTEEPESGESRAEDREAGWLRDHLVGLAKQIEAVGSVIRAGDRCFESDRGAAGQINTAQRVDRSCLARGEIERKTDTAITQVCTCIWENKRRGIVNRSHQSASGTVELQGNVGDRRPRKVPRFRRVVNDHDLVGIGNA